MLYVFFYFFLFRNFYINFFLFFQAPFVTMLVFYQECSSALYNRLICNYPELFNKQVLGNIAYHFNVFIDVGKSIKELNTDDMSTVYEAEHNLRCGQIYDYLNSVFHERIVVRDMGMKVNEYGELSQDDNCTKSLRLDNITVPSSDHTLQKYYRKRKSNYHRSNAEVPIIHIVPIYGRFDEEFVRCDERKNKCVPSIRKHSRKITYYSGIVGIVNGNLTWYCSSSYKAPNVPSQRYPRATLVFRYTPDFVDIFRQILVDFDLYNNIEDDVVLPLPSINNNSGVIILDDDGEEFDDFVINVGNYNMTTSNFYDAQPIQYSNEIIVLDD